MKHRSYTDWVSVLVRYTRTFFSDHYHFYKTITVHHLDEIKNHLDFLVFFTTAIFLTQPSSAVACQSFYMIKLQHLCLQRISMKIIYNLSTAAGEITLFNLKSCVLPKQQEQAQE